MKNEIQLTVLSSLVAAIAGVGCHSGGTQELAPDRFYREEPVGTIESRHVLADRPGVLYNDMHVDLMNKSPQDPFHLKDQGTPPPSVTRISSPSSELAAMASTQPLDLPATQRVTAKPSAGGYMTVGAVVVEINGKPIYADKVLKSLDIEFAAEAKRRDEDAFRLFAETEIRKQVYGFVNDELFFAQAENTLDQNEKDLAYRVTESWKEQQKTEAGGSLQEARAKFAASGIDFDEAANDEYRRNMTRVYIEKKIRPKVQVTATDMRRYYDKNLKTEFSEADTVQYRLITTTVNKSGSREEALKRIKDLHDRATKGEDFQTLATQYNDDPRLARNGGLETPVQRGALRNEKLNEALFNTPQGKLTEIIDSGDAFFLAKIENVKPGRTRSFEDPEVQKSIRDVISKQEMQPLIERERTKLITTGVMIPNPPLLDPVVEMAMQKYAQWASAK